MKRGVALALLFFTLFYLSHCHSWVACTNYLEENGVNYDAAKCLAYPRGWNTRNPTAPFGTDTGYNFQEPQNKCREKYLDETNYNSQYPAARYEAGKKVCLAWPPKNHVAAVCANVYIPDGGTQIWYSQDGDTTWKLLEDWGAFQTPATDNPTDKVRKGYQNCPRFCQDNDKALCTGCFMAPNTTGSYQFQWRWVFNPGDPYITCWDAEVVSSGTITPPLSTPTGNPNTPNPVPTSSPNPNTPNPVPTSSPNPNTPNPPSSNPPPSNVDQNSLITSLNSMVGDSSVIVLLVIVLLLLVVVAVILIVGLLSLRKRMADQL